MTNQPQSFSEEALKGASRDEIMSALFARFVTQQTNMALIFLGKIPHPESGQTVRELASAKMFIDQLEMLEAKTRGNLTKEEDLLLQQSLTALRLAFVEAVEAPGQAANPPPPSPSPAQPAGSPSPENASPSPEETRRRFVKKY